MPRDVQLLHQVVCALLCLNSSCNDGRHFFLPIVIIAISVPVLSPKKTPRERGVSKTTRRLGEGEGRDAGPTTNCHRQLVGKSW